MGGANVKGPFTVKKILVGPNQCNSSDKTGFFGHFGCGTASCERVPNALNNICLKVSGSGCECVTVMLLDGCFVSGYLSMVDIAHSPTSK
jgi:hypothetical protein